MDHAEQISKWIEWERKNKGYLYDKKLVKKEYPVNDSHEHCELCWARFGAYAGDLKQGYFECESQSSYSPIIAKYLAATAYSSQQRPSLSAISSHHFFGFMKLLGM